MNNTIARGPRGSYTPGRGDITGRAYLANTDEKQRRDEALKRTRNALLDGQCVLVGGYLVPRAAFDAVVALAEEQEARS